MADRVRLDYDGPIAIITNDNPDKHNAFDDEMDARLFDILGELRSRPEVRVIIWRGEGKSFSSGRDVSSIGAMQVPLSHHELMRRGHRGIQQLWELDAPVLVACKGWVMGASFQRALLCDLRVAAEGTRFRLPELSYGVIPDTGGVGALFEMAGHGLVSDLVLTSRVLGADEALTHGVVSRVVPEERAGRHRAGDGRAHRGTPGGDGQDGPRGDPAPCPAEHPFVDGRRDDLPDVHQQERRHRRAAGSARRGPRAPLHG